MTTTRVSIDGITLNVDVSGPQDALSTVILLHGWGGHWQSMEPVAHGLAERNYRIHTLDLPGFGESTLPPSAWGVEHYARCVAQYIQAQCSTPVNVVGHSFGGRISIVLGADYASLLSKIVLTSSAGVLPRPTTTSTLVGWGKQVLKLPGLNVFEEQLRKAARERLGSDDYRHAGVLTPIFKNVVTQDLVPFARRITAPTLLIWGDADLDVPLWQAQVLEKAIPDAGLVVFQGAGHFAYQERTPEFIRILDTFFHT